MTGSVALALDADLCNQERQAAAASRHERAQEEELSSDLFGLLAADDTHYTRGSNNHSP